MLRPNLSIPLLFLIIRMFKNADAQYTLYLFICILAMPFCQMKEKMATFVIQWIWFWKHWNLFCSIYMLNLVRVFFLQTKGIPMGGNASPLIADLYLSWLEFEYLDQLNKSKEFDLLNDLKYNCRYIDIITPNVSNFLEITREIVQETAHF